MATTDPELERIAAEQHNCLRCHAMPTLAYRSPTDGEIVDLSIDRNALAHSAHAELSCVECHHRSYTRYPHPRRAAPRDFDCLGCHRDDADPRFAWDHIETEFAHSVHARSEAPNAEGFSCQSCHHPHRFRTTQIGDPLTWIVQEHNQVCLSCHTQLISAASASHDWLPNRAAHWDAVRCVDCHTPADDHANHRILAAEDSPRDCVGCHSADARLLARLYHFRSEEDIARTGLIAKAIYNESYVVGMSRSPLLDRLSLAILVLVVLMLTAHGVGRYLVHREHKRSS
ncbi:nitrate reductase [Thiocapsa imhoffii]|uniref:Nitrate reductase n=1 Tax=Thiocapsa imhoffii TaxID=382777 RepID=A0A9X1B8F2_9GAMM|nr:cytochrome c3 family protein [Thiocapsa imhoffii]MBK1644193.1 nitrate reductase [Thiocapsa imhoffii]